MEPSDALILVILDTLDHFRHLFFYLISSCYNKGHNLNKYDNVEVTNN